MCISNRGNDGIVTFREWHPVGVIEYGYVAPDPLDPDVIFGAGRNVVTKTHLSTGQVQNISPIPVPSPDVRTDRTEPILFSPQDPHRMYYAANRLYATSDGGQSWQTISDDLTRPASGSPPSVGDMHADKAELQRGVIYAVGASPLAKGLLWAGTDDGLIWVTHNEGGAWSNVTPPELGPWSKVTQIEASHFDAAAAYASVSRFRLDDLKPYIYRTRDGGKSWQSIAAGLPQDAPVNAVREDPERRGLLFAATERAVWMSFDDGEHWQSLQLNLPHTSMRDLVVHNQDLIVATHGRSFWVLDDIGPLRAAVNAASAVTLLQPSPAIRARRSTGTDTPIPPDEPSARNPPNGAIIDYYLPQAAKGPASHRSSGFQRRGPKARVEHRLHRLQRSGARKGIDPSVLDSPAQGARHERRECIASSGICTARRRAQSGAAFRFPRFPMTRRRSRWARGWCQGFTACGSKSAATNGNSRSR